MHQGPTRGYHRNGSWFVAHAMDEHLRQPDMIGLRNARFDMGILPRLGGCVTHLAEIRPDGPKHWLRPVSPTDIARPDAGRTALFLLVPVSGRIRHSSLQFEGRRIATPRNVAAERNYLHGEGWQAPWKVVHHSESGVTLSLDGPVSGWPFPYCATATYRLLENGFDLRLTLTNSGSTDMPAGIGVHPWFPAGPAMLQANARTIWHIDERKLFTHTMAVPPRWDFGRGRTLVGTDLEHGFSDWDGDASIWWADRAGRLVIRASRSLRHLVVYTRDPSGDFCVEPVSHSVDGFNLFAAGISGTGTVVLPPRATLEGGATFTVAY